MLFEEELARALPERDLMLTIGVFDGVHLGHQFLIEKLRKKAAREGLLSGVVTFHRHPRLVLSPESKLTYLTSLKERIRLLESLGVAHIITLSFTPELSQLGAREFIGLLKRYLRMRGLVIGPDFALGRGREGDAPTLKALGEELHFSVEVVPPMVWQGEVVSSTAIRHALSRGDVMAVSGLLGRRFTLAGLVTKGDARGRILGIPTANLIPDPEQALPADGVYATRVFRPFKTGLSQRGKLETAARLHDLGKNEISETVYQAVTNIGIRPTFGGGQRIIEVHLLDFEGELYGYEIKIELVERLRGEERFSGAEELKAQIMKDVEQARALLAS
ncbi:MAG: bifunctional riboflavin kinase/FAD synthetase [Dehalococcoidia bacterium]|nr:bifunctional riboflavin kinase/FAD synthetase [Dehalococcoidia bacterium]